MKTYNAQLQSRTVLKVAAVGFAVLEAVSVQARTRPIEGLRISETSLPIAEADAYQTGRGLLAAGDVAGAMAAFRQALRAAPQSVDALNGIGACYDRMGRHDLGRSYYETALIIEPDSAITVHNLGYSLFLDGDYTAAIPLLQRAAASVDNAVSANGRRMLALTAEKLRMARTASSIAIDRADGVPAAGVIQFATASLPQPGPPQAAIGRNRRDAATARTTDQPVHLSIIARQARIEQSTNGEQRLVFGPVRPDPVLVASLGDAAVLVLVAPAWTARDESTMAFTEAARLRLAARAAAADIAELFAVESSPSAIAELAVPATAARLAAQFPAAAGPGQSAVPANAPANSDSNQTITALQAPARRLRDATGKAEIAPAPPARPTARHGLLADDDAPPVGWLLASGSAGGKGGATKTATQGPQVKGAVLGFDSDNRELNAFAARMRGMAPAPVSNVEAVARLEALVARLRAA